MNRAVHIERFGPGDAVAAPLPGDFILVAGNDLLSAFIRWAERRRFRRADERPYTHWSHTALVTSRQGRIVEVVPRGVVAQSLAKYRPQEYCYVHVGGTLEERRAAVRFAEDCLGQSYATASWLTFMLGVFLARPLPLRDGGRQSCASLVAGALARGHAIFDRTPLDMTPADLARHYGVTP
jgi:hypothetical protein